MTVKRLDGGQLGAFLDRTASGSATLVAPVDRGGVTLLGPVSGASEVDLDCILPVNSVKDCLFPHNDALYRYRTGPDSLEIEPTADHGRSVLFGLRPCDLASVSLLDKVFTTGDFDDAQYTARRASTVMVGVACTRAAPSCLCTSFGVTPGSPGAADVMLYPEGNGYLAVALTDRGRELVADMGGDDASDEELEAARAASEATEVPLSSRVDPSGLDTAMPGMWDSPYWQRLSMRCLGCGTCTFLCPTCHCFLLADVNRGRDGVRFKCWDSCQFASFLAGAGGHNPRPSRKERVRQRFMHKLSYYPERYGSFLCTGCGRCVSRCPVDLHVAGVVSDLKEVDADAGS